MKRIAFIFATILYFSVLLCVHAAAADYDLLMGDVDSNGALTAGDARMVLRASAGLEKLSEEALIVADTDFDGAPSAGDARMVLRASAGLEKIANFQHKHDMEQKTTSGSCLDPSITSEVCKKCATTVVTGYAPAPGHSWTAYVRIEDSHYRECSVCKEIDTAKCSLEVVTDKPATCTEDGLLVKSCVCGFSERTEIKGGHAYGAWTKQTDGSFKSTCPKCADSRIATKEVMLNWFNNNVNRMKLQEDYAQTVSTVRFTNTVSAPSNYSLSLLPVMSLLEESLAYEKTEYGKPVFNRKITQNNLPAMTRPVVSDLTMADIKSFDVVLGQTVNILADVPDVIEYVITQDGEEVTESVDISAYKNRIPATDAIKISIAVNDEVATATGMDGVSNVYSYTSGGKSVQVSEENPLVMERFYGLALPKLCEEFPKIGTGDTMSMLLDCPTASSHGTADWYFDSQTLEPIACKYNIEFNMYQDVTMESTLLNGTLDLDIKIHYTYIFLFSDYYTD